MSAAAVLVTALAGVGVGIASGLVGIGGGVLLVPFLYFLLGHPGWSGIEVDPSLHAVTAHATSLLVIVPTAASGLLSYRRSRLVDGRAAWGLGAPAVIAALIGASIATELPVAALKAAFGALVVFSGLRLLRPPRTRSDRPAAVASEPGGEMDLAVEAPLPPRDAPIRATTSALPWTSAEARTVGPQRFWTVAVSGGFLVGLTSALLGVGGGVIAIPILIGGLHLPIGRVAGTSLGIILFAAISGVAAYASGGWGDPMIGETSLGYLLLVPAVVLTPGAIVGARVGAAVNQRMDAVLLRILFSVLLLVLGTRLVVLNVPGLLG